MSNLRTATDEELREKIDAGQQTIDYFSSDTFDHEEYGRRANYSYAKLFYVTALKKSCEEELLRRAVVSEWLSA